MRRFPKGDRKAARRAPSFGRLVRGETVTCGDFAATPRRLPQKEGDHSRSEWWKIYAPTTAANSPKRKPTLSQPYG